MSLPIWTTTFADAVPSLEASPLKPHHPTVRWSMRGKSNPSLASVDVPFWLVLPEDDARHF